MSVGSLTISSNKSCVLAIEAVSVLSNINLASLSLSLQCSGMWMRTEHSYNAGTYFQVSYTS